jgi:hypothetical protein
MALLALAAKLALMLIILFMATQAIQRGISEAVQVLVTGVTFQHQFRVGIAKGELGSVVKEPSGS